MKGLIVLLLVLGGLKEGDIGFLQEGLKEVLTAQVVIQRGTEDLSFAHNPERGQFLASAILRFMRKDTYPKVDRILGIVDVDLYAPGLNFVFGQAEITGRMAIISLRRLRQGFYGLPEDEALFMERALKEAVHELGHTFGLSHCSDRSCVMAFSNTLTDTDYKSYNFCRRCRRFLRERIGP